MAWKRIHFVTFQIIQLALCEPKCPESFPFLIEYAKSFYFNLSSTNKFFFREECYSTEGHSDLQESTFKCASKNGRVMSPLEFSDWPSKIQTFGIGQTTIASGEKNHWK